MAGKTGTTDSYKDLVFVGYTPYYTCGIWTGYDTNEELSENERQYINTLWTNVMNRIHEGKAAKNFAVPDSVEEVSTGGNRMSGVDRVFRRRNGPDNGLHAAHSDARSDGCPDSSTGYNAGGFPGG